MWNLKTYAHVGLLIVLMCAGCSPRYYFYNSSPETIHCFGKNTLPQYMWSGIPEVNLLSALKRVNGSFAGKSGIYRWVFEEHSDVDTQGNCKEDGAYTNLAAHVTVFSQPVSPPPSGNSNQKVQSKTDVNIATTNPSQPSQGSKKTTEPQNSGGKGQQGNGQQNGQTSQDSQGQKNDIGQAEQLAWESQRIQQVQIILSAYLYSLEPSDRLEKVYTLITPLHPGVEFLEAKATRSVTLISFGQLTTHNEIGATIGVPVGGLPSPISLTTKTSQEIQRQIEHQYTTQNVEIFPLKNILLISEDGGPAKAAIEGNSATEITFRIPPDLCQPVNVFTMKMIPTNITETSRKTSSEKQKEFTIEHTCHIGEVRALVASLAVARRVQLWESTINEDDDWIRMVPFKTAAVINLSGKSSNLYGVVVNTGNDRVPVMFTIDKGLRGQMLFDNLNTALDFHAWLLEQMQQSGKSNELVQGKLWWKEGKVTVRLSQTIAESLIKADALQICTYGTPESDLTNYGIQSRHDLCGKETP